LMSYVKRNTFANDDDDDDDDDDNDDDGRIIIIPELHRVSEKCHRSHICVTYIRYTHTHTHTHTHVSI